MANGKIENIGNFYEGYILTLDNNTFEIDLMPISIKSFDVIVGMDWLSTNHADILCYEKTIRLNLSYRKTLVIYDDKPSSTLQIVSSVKA